MFVSPANLIETYQQAYERANGKRVLTVTFERGWYVFRTNPKSREVFDRVRRATLIEMTERLNARPAAA